ncbi:unnamed protein product [Callosobruchus maculatus]|uniref:Nucleolar protein 8 n=1 Tax=Callosobruchus maculatus TaxID=64391 RepID=A0A653BF70_CALMS|nr:unnamed protein product [Callosobruchus maculatus]
MGFKDFSNRKWHNQYVMLQLARESFLERLKKEREANTDCNVSESTPKRIIHNNSLNGDVKKSQTSSLNEECYRQDEEKGIEEKYEIAISRVEPDIDIVIKNNKGKELHKNGLKIPSFGNKPVARIEKTKTNVGNESDANLKRLQSLKKLKSQYQNKKLLIKAALSNVDSTPKNKIIFEETDDMPRNRRKKSKEGQNRPLFDELDDEDFTANFAIKEQFEGLEGQKLLQLQSKYKHDKRFVLDSRFLDKSKEPMPNDHEVANDADMTLLDEKKKEYEILNEIFGKNITRKSTSGVESTKKTMLRFDPSQPDHTRYEVQRVVEKSKERKKENQLLESKKVEEKKPHSVSKEIFYKVTEDLKECLQEKEGFSLLNLFGKAEDKELDEKEEYKDTSVPVDISDEVGGRNPFQYDSSDDGDDPTEDTPNKEGDYCIRSEQVSSGNVRKDFWTESFFFKDDDYRLQEGSDFMERIKSDGYTEDFCKVRRNVKEIVKAKIKNNQRRNRPLKQKLGGNKKKKFIRMKKAMKR